MNPDPHLSDDRTFTAGAFHPDLPPAGVAGALRLTGAGAHFQSDRGGFTLPLDGLAIRLGGDNDRMVFLSHPAQPKTSIHTEDHRILRHPAITGLSSLAAQRGRARTRQRSTGAALLACVTALLLAAVLLFWSKDRMVAAVASSVPVEWEIKAGDALFDRVIAGQRVIRDPALLAQLKVLTDPLVNGIDDERYPLRFHIVEDASLNAFAMPGGNAVIHTGLLLAADTAEEVAGVLAHEIAHITRRHSIRRIISSSGLYLIVSYFFGDISGILGVLADNSAFLLERKFTRDFERDADNAGWDYLVRSGIDPRGMITFFKKMQAADAEDAGKSPGSGVAGALSVLSTHPATAERIAALEEKLKAGAEPGTYAPLPLDYAAFKQSVRALLPAVETSAK